MRSETNQILVAYFSRTGNTRTLAQYIHEVVGGAIFKIQPEQAYPNSYNDVVDQAKQELNNNARPTLQHHVTDMDTYQVIFLGYPNWWGTMPMAVHTFLESYDFSGKTIIPFCTHGGSSLGRSVEDIKQICPDATIRDGLAIRGSNVNHAQDQIFNWLQSLSIID